MKKARTVLTNGVVELEVKCNRYDASVDVRDHILAQDGRGQYYIDGIKAHLITIIEEDPEWNEIMDHLITEIEKDPEWNGKIN